MNCCTPLHGLYAVSGFARLTYPAQQKQAWAAATITLVLVVYLPLLWYRKAIKLDLHAGWCTFLFSADVFRQGPCVSIQVHHGDSHGWCMWVWPPLILLLRRFKSFFIKLKKGAGCLVSGGHQVSLLRRRMHCYGINNHFHSSSDNNNNHRGMDNVWI